jgi:hypothetical protein
MEVAREKRKMNDKLQTKTTLSQQVLFLGVADFFQLADTPYPFGPIDLFQLSKHKHHIVYPGIIASNACVLLVSNDFIENSDLSKWKIRIADEDDSELVNASFATFPVNGKILPTLEESETKFAIVIEKDTDFTLLHFKINTLVNHPGSYVVQSIYDGKTTEIGTVYFHYQKQPSLTADKIKAIESDPNSAKAVRMELGCKNCPTKLNVYTGIQRQPKLEKEGFVWYTDIGKEFKCECGKVRYSLEYLKESMHGMLLKDFSREYSGLGYVRRYGHTQVVKIVKEFTELLNNECLEPPVQNYIEKHPVLLSRFYAKRLFIKPKIIGKFEADFAVVDSMNQLWLIELEKPSMQLFKRGGHPTQALMHAYGQVTDWLHTYTKYPAAILDVLSLKEGDVVAVRGAVIAGRSTDVGHEVLQRHLSNPPYPNIEFMTCDDLGVSLLNISRKLA